MFVDLSSIISAILSSIGIVNVVCGGKYLKKGIINILIVICILLFCVKVTEKMDSIQYKYTEPHAIENITALNDSYEINGKIRPLRASYIDEKLYYHYLITTNDGKIIQKKITADNSSVYTSDNPRIEWVYKYKKWFIFEDKELWYNIYIPENSIDYSFNIDLE